MRTNKQNPSARQHVAKLLSDYSCKKLSGDQFVNEVVNVSYNKDENLDLVVDWVFETFEPEFGKPSEGVAGVAAKRSPQRKWCPGRSLKINTRSVSLDALLCSFHLHRVRWGLRLTPATPATRSIARSLQFNSMDIDSPSEQERPQPSELTSDLWKLRQQKVASGVPLLTEEELDKERVERQAIRRGWLGS
ncbi:MAG: hypothetical protein WD851_21255 [Pirellulales bacterium]